MFGGRVRRGTSSANVLGRSAAVIKVPQTGGECAVGRRPVLRAGLAWPVHRQRAVHDDPGRDEAGLREPGNRAGPVLQ